MDPHRFSIGYCLGIGGSTIIDWQSTHIGHLENYSNIYHSRGTSSQSVSHRQSMGHWDFDQVGIEFRAGWN